MEDDAVKKKGKGKQIYEEPRHIEQAKFLPGCRHGTLQIGDVEYCDVPAAMLAKSVQEEEEAESLRAYLNEVLGKNQGSYTDLLNEQIRMSQEKNGDSVQMPTKNIEMVNGTTFMGLLTTDYGFKQVRLPQGTPLEFENMPMDDFEEEVDTMTMYSLPSDDEIVDIECIEAHLKQSKAYDMSKAQGRHTVLVQANNNMISDSTKENENVKNNLQGQMELSVHGEEEMKGQKELPEDGYEIEKNKVRYGTDEELGLNNDSDWRENLFTNMQLEEVGVQENGNGNNIETETEKGDEGTSEDPTNGIQEVTEEWIDEFIRSEQIAASEGNNADTDSKYTPQIDQQFKSREDAHHFFSFYAFIAGFQVKTTHTTRSTSKKRDNEIYKVEIRCVRHGKEKESTKLQQEELAVVEDTNKEERDTNVQVKTDCPVVMVVKLENGFWRIVRLELDHNHELSPGNRNQLFSGRKYMTDMEKAMIRTLNDNNIPTRKMIAILSYLRC
ncbi:unnamed protein product [Urochloa decumbens]|uniref:FAR1 domain-containing protein n=1 Tax=Urochloa decumbens TaxID=240449 RepID=A0ABC9BGK8_9POAL